MVFSINLGANSKREPIGDLGSDWTIHPKARVESQGGGAAADSGSTGHSGELIDVGIADHRNSQGWGDVPVEAVRFFRLFFHPRRDVIFLIHRGGGGRGQRSLASRNRAGEQAKPD